MKKKRAEEIYGNISERGVCEWEREKDENRSHKNQLTYWIRDVWHKFF